MNPGCCAELGTSIAHYLPKGLSRFGPEVSCLMLLKPCAALYEQRQPTMLAQTQKYRHDHDSVMID